MSDILVSISCITYNHEKYIREALDSFLMQKTNFKYEILIHDDASTDGTQDIIKEYERKYPDIIKPILQTENQFSKGVKRIMYIYNDSRAKGKYIALCEGDDYWTDPNKLQKQVDYMESHSDCSMCFHAGEIYDNKLKKVTNVQRAYDKNCIASNEDLIVKGGGFIITSSMFYRRSLLENAPDFFLNAHVGDYAMQLLFMSKGNVYYMDLPMSVYRIFVEGSWTSNNLLTNNEKKSRISNSLKDINLLKDFNMYSQEKFAKEIKKGIFISLENVVMLEGNLKILKTDRFEKVYNEFDWKIKLKLFCECYFPHTLRVLSYINRKLKTTK